MKTFTEKEIHPLQSIEQWEDDVLVRYPEANAPAKAKEEFRNYEDTKRESVKEFLPAQSHLPVVRFRDGKKK